MRSCVQPLLQGLRCQDKAFLFPLFSPLNNIRGEMGARKTSSFRGAQCVMKSNYFLPSAPPAGTRGLFLPESKGGQPHKKSDDVYGDWEVEMDDSFFGYISD